MNTSQITEALVKRAVEGVEAQGAIAYDHDAEMCRLRTSNLKCAVGQLFDDEYYEQRMELYAAPGSPASEDVREAIIKSNPDLNLSENFDQPYWRILNKLQDCHDDSDTVEEFLSRTRVMLRENGFTFEI